MQSISSRAKQIITSATCALALTSGCIATNAPTEPSQGSAVASPDREGAGHVEGFDLGLSATCPSGTNGSSAARAAASFAVQLVKAQIETTGWVEGTSVIFSQHFRPRVGGGIEQVSYPGVPVSAKAQSILLAAQQDPAVAKYLEDGLSRCRSTTNGLWVANSNLLDRVANMNAGQPGWATADCGSVQACITWDWWDQDWCGQRAISARQTFKSYPNAINIFELYNGDVFIDLINQAKGSYTGTSALPCSPFEGPTGNNPWFVNEMNGVQRTFQDPALYQTYTCTGTTPCVFQLDVDPIAYLESGTVYNSAGLVGTSSNPFILDSSALYALSEHQNKWAGRIVNGVYERGQFATLVYLAGQPYYKYASASTATATTTTTREVETGTLTGGTGSCIRIQSASSASASQVVGCFNTQGDIVTLNGINGGSQGGICTVTLRGANGSSVNGQVSLHLNGVDTNIDFIIPPTGSWNTFANSNVASVYMNAGTTNNIRLRRNAGDTAIDMDRVTVVCQ